MRLSWFHRETVGNAERLPADTELDSLPKRLRTLFEAHGCYTLRDAARVRACAFILWDGVGYKSLGKARQLLR